MSSFNTRVMSWRRPQWKSASGRGNRHCPKSRVGDTYNLNLDSCLTAIIAIPPYIVVSPVRAPTPENAAPPSDDSSNATRDSDQCVEMGDAVLTKGCDIESSTCYNPLFEMDNWRLLSQPYSFTLEETIKHLVNVGYDVEARTASGLTPLLHLVTTYKPQVIKCIRALIVDGANVNATDLAGRGALHHALAVPHVFDGWKTLRLIFWAPHTFLNHYYVPAYVYQTESFAHAEDYQQVNTTLYHDRGYDRILCEDLGGARHCIDHPVQVLKTRLKYKLLALLKANCDPNIPDTYGSTPNNYAVQDDLWPEWSWALERSGYVYKAEEDRWFKDSAIY